jgi:hypothetical protein
MLREDAVTARPHHHLRRALACAPLLLALGVQPAAAAAREIAQACVAVGCFPGDGPGFPVQITTPGHYRLTSNLDVRAFPGAANLGAIDITAAEVDLDLGGFALLGPTTCPGPPPVPCSPLGSGAGVRSNGQGTTVRDGSVVGFGSSGVSLLSGRIDRVRASHNGGNGLAAFGEGSLVVDSLAFRNGNDGIQTYRYAVITGCTVAENLHDGILARQVTSVEETISRANGRVGYWAETELRLRHAVATANGNGGLSGYVYGSVGAGNGTYGVTEGFPNESAVVQSALSANSGAALASGVYDLGQNVCDGASC